MTDVAELLARLVEELRGERTAAHTGAVGLEDAVDLADAVGGDAQAGADSGADRIRRRHEGIRTEIDVEQRALGALGQDGLVLRQAVVDEVFAVDDLEAAEVFHGVEPLCLELRDVVLVVQTAENALVTGLGGGVDLLEIGAQQIAHTHAVAADLVGVGRADALARRTDLGAALGGLVGGIEDPVRREDQMGFFRNAELLGDVVAALGELFGLGAEQNGIQNDAVSDDVGFTALEDSRGNRAEHVFLPAELQRMTGIGTTLESGYNLVMGREHVHDLSLALVAPLEAEDNVYFFHCIRISYLVTKDIFCIQRYEIIREKRNVAARLFNKL